MVRITLVEPQANQTQSNTLSFRPTGEIFLDPTHSPVNWRALRLCGSHYLFILAGRFEPLRGNHRHAFDFYHQRRVGKPHDPDQCAGR